MNKSLLISAGVTAALALCAVFAKSILGSPIFAQTVGSVVIAGIFVTGGLLAVQTISFVKEASEDRGNRNEANWASRQRAMLEELSSQLVATSAAVIRQSISPRTEFRGDYDEAPELRFSSPNNESGIVLPAFIAQKAFGKDNVVLDLRLRFAGQYRESKTYVPELVMLPSPINTGLMIIISLSSEQVLAFRIAKQDRLNEETLVRSYGTVFPGSPVFPPPWLPFGAFALVDIKISSTDG